MFWSMGTRPTMPIQHPRMIQALLDGPLDMVNGARVTTIEKAYRPGHRFGNWMLTSMVSWVFGNRFKDILSGYRVFSRRYVKSFPALAAGFETETELTVHALELRMPTAEITTPYKDRPPGSVSKLSTLSRWLSHSLDNYCLGKRRKTNALLSLFVIFFSRCINSHSLFLF